MTEGHTSLLEKWRRFRSRPPEDRRLIARAALLLPLTKLGLRCFGFQLAKNWIEKLSSPVNQKVVPKRDDQLGVAMRVTRAVLSAQLHGPVSPNCLERSLTLWWILRNEGVNGELHIGARKQEAQLEAHAWVEWGGRVLNDGEEVRHEYALFDGPIASGVDSSRASGKSFSD